MGFAIWRLRGIPYTFLSRLYTVLILEILLTNTLSCMYVCTVTDCMVHPSQHDTIVSSSLGGQVKAFNASSSLSIDCLDTIGAVTSLDYDLDSSMMLAVTSVGGLVRMKL